MINKLKECLLKYPIVYFSIYFLFALKPKFEFFYPQITNFYKYFHYFLMLWGVTIIVTNFRFYFKFFTNNKIKSILLFFGAIILTIIYNLKSISGDSVKTSILTIFVVILFLPAYSLLKEKYSKDQIFRIIFYPNFVFKGLIGIVSLVMYLFNISIFIIGENNVLYYAGVRYVEAQGGQYTLLSYGIYNDPNYAAVYSITILVLAIYMIFSKMYRNNIEKILLIIFIVLEFISMQLNNSRGTELGIYASLILLALYLVVKVLKGKIDKTLFKKEILYIIVLLLITGVGGKLVKNVSFNILNINTPQKYLLIEENKKIKEVINLGNDNSEKILSKYFKGNSAEVIGPKTDIKDNITLEKVDSSREYGNGRITIWKDAMVLSKKSIIFGIGPDMQKKFSQKYPNLDVPTMKVGRALHNSYIQLYLSFGFVGFITMMYWLLGAVKSVVVKDYKENNISNQILIVGLLCLAVASMFLESIFVNLNYQQMYLFFILGILLYESADKKGAK